MLCPSKNLRSKFSVIFSFTLKNEASPPQLPTTQEKKEKKEKKKLAEPIGLASSLLALATFVFKASLSLYETVNIFRSYIKRVRDLIEKLESLSGVLAPLQELLDITTDKNLSILELLLRRYGNACSEFE